MTPERAPRSELSELANRDELRYREGVQARTETPDAFLRKIEASGRLRLLDHLRSRRLIAPAGSVLEIGAGTGWLSAQLSRVPEVAVVYATDFSPRLVDEVMPFVSRALDADSAKLVRRVADFHRLPFEPRTFDWVFADSALHHATDVVSLLVEIRRVLKPAGRLVALREPVRPTFSALQRRTRRDVVDDLAGHGVAEPLFSRAEWNGFFSGAGFDLLWHDVSFSRGVRRWLSVRANGVFKADYCMVGLPRT